GHDEVACVIESDAPVVRAPMAGGIAGDAVDGSCVTYAHELAGGSAVRRHIGEALRGGDGRRAGRAGNLRDRDVPLRRLPAGAVDTFEVGHVEPPRVTGDDVREHAARLPRGDDGDRGRPVAEVRRGPADQDRRSAEVRVWSRTLRIDGID